MPVIIQPPFPIRAVPGSQAHSIRSGSQYIPLRRSHSQGSKRVAQGELDLDEATRNQPIGRLGTADEIAAAVLWLCSPGASFVVGVALPVDGGYTAT
jgi:NAD(P)-dependent dehydrogenase (short-subunit alcohol dehydrogenase family)